MKRILQIAMLISLSVQAQAQVKIGLRVAPQITWGQADNKNSFSNGTRANFSYGLMLDYYFTENYAIGTEVCLYYFGTNQNIKKESYSSISHNNVSYPNNDNLTFDYRLRYFQIPLMLKMRTNEIGYMRYFAEFGFNAGILTRARADIYTTNFELNNVNVNNPDAADNYTITPTNFEDDINMFKAGMVIGAGFQRNFFSNSLLQIGVRYESGLTNYQKDERLKSTLNFLALNIGILF